MGANGLVVRTSKGLVHYSFESVHCQCEEVSLTLHPMLPIILVQAILYSPIVAGPVYSMNVLYLES